MYILLLRWCKYNKKILELQVFDVFFRLKNVLWWVFVSNHPVKLDKMDII